MYKNSSQTTEHASISIYYFLWTLILSFVIEKIRMFGLSDYNILLCDLAVSLLLSSFD